MPFLSDANIPNLANIEADEIDEVCAEDSRLIYVGITRAKGAVLITYTGEVTRLLPQDGSLYAKASR